MHDKHKSTSPSPSSPNSTDGTSPDSSPKDSTKDRRGNAFDPEFLRRRQAREDEPHAAVEAESRGPWTVVERHAERYEVFRSWEDPETDEPAAVFRFRELAYLYAAGLEVGGRGSMLVVGREPTAAGQQPV